ncbi:uncharacterized protein [Ptychodera flava]|uniref:uncharacterized protein isoform X2 n=1 Tax=Ptychodera flava TaxID=63121 RepID=UPI00396A0A94
MSSGVQEQRATEKEYDVSFSYHKDSYAWVKDMAGKLERNHGRTCAIAERDFIPGKSVFENMATVLQKARVMVMVLTQSFVESGWCTYEAQLGLRDHLTRQQCMVVPVMLEKCTKPYFIDHLTHLDAGDEGFEERFTKIVASDNSEDTKEFSFGERIDEFNGKIITTQKSETKRYVTYFDMMKAYKSLTAKGIPITETDLKEAFNELGNTDLWAMWRYYWSVLIVIIFVYWIYVLYKTALLCFEFQNIATSMICIILGSIAVVFSSVQIDQRSVVVAIEVLVNQSRWSDKVSIGIQNNILIKLLYYVNILLYIFLIFNPGLMVVIDPLKMFSCVMIENEFIKNCIELIKLVSVFMAYLSLPIGFSFTTIRSRAIHEGKANAVFLKHKIMAGLVRRGLIRRSFIVSFTGRSSIYISKLNIFDVLMNYIL